MPVLRWLKKTLSGATQDPVPERQRARELIAAIDAGGMPLHPGRVNAIARDLGLDVSSAAPMEHTVARIREALVRSSGV